MSKTRTNTPIDEVDRLACEEGVENLEADGKTRSLRAFNRTFLIEEAPAGKNGLFKVISKTDDPEDAGYEGMETRDSIRRLFRRAVKWRERVP
jgi:hypothetical protein